MRKDAGVSHYFLRCPRTGLPREPGTRALGRRGRTPGDGMATESTEKHGHTQYPLEFLSVDSVANDKRTDSQPDLSASVIVKLKHY
jgi:hypothetical protein